MKVKQDFPVKIIAKGTGSVLTTKDIHRTFLPEFLAQRTGSVLVSTAFSIRTIWSDSYINRT